MWSEETSNSEKDLDVDFPDVCIEFDDPKVKFLTPGAVLLADPDKKREEIKSILSGHPSLVSNSVGTTRDKWTHILPNRDHADVKEVWFAGDLTVHNVSTITHNENWQYNFQVRIQMLGEAAVFLIRVYHSYPCAG